MRNLHPEDATLACEVLDRVLQLRLDMDIPKEIPDKMVKHCVLILKALIALYQPTPFSKSEKRGLPKVDPELIQYFQKGAITSEKAKSSTISFIVQKLAPGWIVTGAGGRGGFSTIDEVIKQVTEVVRILDLTTPEGREGWDALKITLTPTKGGS